jgi:hypothetical protein
MSLPPSPARRTSTPTPATGASSSTCRTPTVWRNVSTVREALVWFPSSSVTVNVTVCRPGWGQAWPTRIGAVLWEVTPSPKSQS